MFLHFLNSGDVISSDSFDTFRIELGFNITQIFIFESYITFLGEKEARKVNFLEFEFDRTRILSCVNDKSSEQILTVGKRKRQTGDDISNFLTNLERLFLRPSCEINE
jgi:hypothetical protein